MTADEKSSICYFLGKLSDDPEDIDWIQTILNISKQEQSLKLSKLISGEKDTKLYVKKRAIISGISS